MSFDLLDLLDLLSTSLPVCLLLQSAGAESLLRLRVPAVPVTQLVINASAAVHVRPSTLKSTNYASSAEMCVGSSVTTTLADTWVAAMRFEVPSPASVTSAVLRLTLSSLSSALTANMPMLLLGISANSWAASNVTWAALSGTAGPLKPHPPSGAASTFKLDSIRANFINYAHPGLSVVGHITLPSGLTTAQAGGLVKQVDVTPFVRSSTGPVSLLLARPFRNNAETAAGGNSMPKDAVNSGARACFAASGATRPVLILQRTA